MIKKIIFISFFPFILNAQNDTLKNMNNQVISVNEIGINNLIQKYEAILKNKKGIEGWRIQLKFKAKESEIVKLKLKFISLYPEIPVTLEYQEPYYRIRVGNCRTKLEALKIKDKIKKEFRDAYPVPEIINFSLINN